MKHANRLRISFGVALVAGLVACSVTHPVFAHKYHTSLTQMEYNRQEGSIEITLRIFADDLENILSKRSGKSVRLDITKDAAALTLAYLKDKFQLKDRDGEIKPLQWVGMETQVDTVWAYVEVKMSEGLAGAQLRNSILFDLFDDQVNLVNIKSKGEKSDLVFKPGDGFKSIPTLSSDKPVS